MRNIFWPPWIFWIFVRVQGLLEAEGDGWTHKRRVIGQTGFLSLTGQVTTFSHKKQQFFLCLALQAFIRLEPRPVKKMFWRLLSSSFGINPLLPWLPQVLSLPFSYSFFTLCLLMGEENRPLWNDNKKVYIGLFQNYVPPTNLSIPASVRRWG